jgi:hypothetical protein
MVMDHAFHEYVDVPTAAHELGISERQLWRLLRRSSVPRYTLPQQRRRIFIRRADLPVLMEPARAEGPATRVVMNPGHDEPSAPVGGRMTIAPLSNEVHYTAKNVATQQARMGIAPAAQQLVCELLRQHRLAAGLRQIDLAGRLGQPQVFVSNYERGDRRLDILEVRRICQELGLSLPEFVRQLEGALAVAGEPSTSDE